MIEAQSRALSSVARRRGLLVSERRLLLASGDGLAVVAAFLVAFNLRTAPARDAGFAVPRVSTAIAAVTWLAMANLVDAYDLRAAVNLRATLRNVGVTLALTTVGLLGVFFVEPYRITRPTLLLWVPLAGAAVLAWRLTYRRVFAAAIFAGRVVLIVDPMSLEFVWPEVRNQMGGLYRVVGVIDPTREDSARRLEKVVADRRGDQIILGVRDEVSRDLFRSLLRCYDHGVIVRSLADLYEEITGRLLLDQLGHTWLVSLPMRSETSRLYSAFKRTMDVLVSAVGLVLLIPLLPVIALAVFLEDGGDPLHTQSRVGKYGRLFTIIKFRTMRRDAGSDLSWTGAGDSRVTRVGWALRKLHLDELPQAWNILKGDMSLIGPRPEQPQYVEPLRDAVDFYNTRLSVRPGLTGWAQVNYGYGSGVEGARVKLSYDLYYIKRQSAALDVLILARTLFAVMSLSGH